MRDVTRILRWAALGLVAVLLVSCARPGEDEGVPCTISLRPGEEIQAALDLAPPGAVICLGAGTWTESLRVTKPVTLRGAGPTKTIVRSAQLGHPALTIEGPLAGEGPVVIVGIKFSEASGAAGLLVAGEATVEVERSTFSDNRGPGVALHDRALVSVHSSTISANTGYGVHIQGQVQATLDGVTIADNRSSGVWLADTARLILTQSTVTRCEGHGLWIRDESHLTATGSTVSSCEGYGLWVRDQASADLTRCTIAGHRDAGVWAEDAAEVALTSSTVEGTWDGVVAREASSLRLADCTVSRVRWDGIKLQGTAVGSIVASTISGGRGVGISVRGAAHAEIRDNRIEGWTAQGILSLSRIPPSGGGNRMQGNGVDLVGNLPGSLRAPLVAASREEVRFPSRDYATIQEAADALLPGGKLVLAEGIYPAGVTLGKPIRIEAEGIVLLTAKATRESAVVSLVGGADLALTGVAVGYGSEGLVMDADARAVVTDCVLSDNLRGIHAVGDTALELLRCRLSRNEQGGMWLGERATATVRETVFTQNEVWGIGLGETAAAVITDCLITASGGSGGIALRDSAQAEIVGNSIVGSKGAGIALYHGYCIGAGYVFTGRVCGGANTIRDNAKGDVCPADLAFLAGEWGELDWRQED
ncbi:MAG: right-handed parallel beta-helix repeat-containing protein [Candidatus Bipolaricaulis sp.]